MNCKHCYCIPFNFSKTGESGAERYEELYRKEIIKVKKYHKMWCECKKESENSIPKEKVMEVLDERYNEIIHDNYGMIRATEIKKIKKQLLGEE